jgi:hypothetical protein
VLKSIVLISFSLIFISVLTGAAYEEDQFLFLNEIEPGMRGVGKTVVAADVISEFSAEVLGVIDQPGDDSDFIVVRVSGEAIDASGGISQGMSGSPIYIDEKLIGALSRAAAWSKESSPIGLVTPIEGMLTIIDQMKEESQPPVKKKEMLSQVRLVECDFPPSTAKLKANPHTIFSYPVSSPLLVHGLSGRSIDVLMNGIDPEVAPSGLLSEFLPLTIAPGPRGLSSLGLLFNQPTAIGGDGSGESSVLEPGGAIGVGLASGDVRIGALGTLTYMDSADLIGFGHRFLLNGRATFPLTRVHIYDTMKTYDASFKLGTLREPIGTILQDRTAGIGGSIGQLPEGIDFSVAVTDIDTESSDTLHIELVDEPRLMWELLLATGLEAIDEILDRIGQGTVEVDYQIDGEGMPRALNRRDIFLSTRDIALYPPWQLANIISLLQYNEFKDPQITRISTSMCVQQEIKAMRITHLELDKEIYSPGDTIQYRVQLQTYHGKRRVEEGQIEIPPGLTADYVTVRAYGGPRPLEEGEAPIEFEELADLMETIEELPSNDTLTVELFAPNPFSPYLDALYGVDEVEIDLPGYVLYDEREITALLLWEE